MSPPLVGGSSGIESGLLEGLNGYFCLVSVIKPDQLYAIVTTLSGDGTVDLTSWVETW